MGKNDVAMPRSRGLFRFLGRIGVKTRDFGHRTKFEGRGFAKHGRYSAGRATNLVVAASKKPQDASPSTTSDEVEGVSIGIDLGTTNSLVAYVDPDTNEPEILPGAPSLDLDNPEKPMLIGGNQEVPPDSLLLPSAVAYLPSKNGSRVIVGRDAERLAAAGAGGKISRAGGAVFASVKRVIGRVRREAEASASVQLLRSQLADGLEDDPASLNCPAHPAGEISPEEVSGYIVSGLKARAELALQQKVTKAVVTVPAWFGDDQRQATERAAMRAGFEKVRLLREPEAAAMAYGIEKEQDQLVLVFDLGGGTFDCSVLEVGGGAIEVLTTGGDDKLGGDDFDTAIINVIPSKQHNPNTDPNPTLLP